MTLLMALVLVSLVGMLLGHVVAVVAYALVAVDVDVVVHGDKIALHRYFAKVPNALEHDT